MPLVFIDPIHGRVMIPDEFRLVVESPVLARLRNVRQLGFTLARYPGAVHTRFEHTLGTVASLMQLMRQLGNQDSQSYSLFILAALVSEIGIPPLSYSSRPVFKKYGLSKSSYAVGLYSNYLRHELGLGASEESFLFDKNLRRESWFHVVSQHKEFAHLEPVELASTIDYVLRDSYYTGRFGGGFDYRFFSSLLTNDGLSESNEIRDGLRALHRSVHILNATYGDPARRVLTILLSRLVDRLIEGEFLDLSNLKDVRSLLELDDDEFLYQIGSGVRRASDAGDTLSERIHNAVIQRVAPRIEFISLRTAGVSPDEETESVRSKVAHMLSWPSEQVILFDPRFDDIIGFRVFGEEFQNYDEAVRSAIFQERTGLIIHDNLPEHSDHHVLVFLI